MTDTVNLKLPTIDGGQAQKHVTHNEALRVLDALVMAAVLDRDLTAPPGAPADGARYLVKSGGSGGFAGHDNQIAHYADGGWTFYAPQLGWTVYVADESLLVAWNGTAWAAAIDVLGLTAIQNLSLFGLGTTADMFNPLSAKLNNALLLGKTVAEGGDGTLRLKLSKESASKTASLLLQDNFSGRAELGLTGDDDFHIKVSADGASWQDALVVNRATGKLSFPARGGPREILTAARSYYVRTDGSDANSGLVNSAGGAFLTIQKAVDIAAALDLSIYDVTIQVGNGTYTGQVLLKSTVGAGKVKLLGDTATPSNVLISVTAPSDAAILADSLRGIYSIRGFRIATITSGHCIHARGSVIEFDSVDFGLAAGGYSHIYVEALSRLTATGNYSISGGAGAHLFGRGASYIDTVGRTVTLTGTPAFSWTFVYVESTANY